MKVSRWNEIWICTPVAFSAQIFNSESNSNKHEKLLLIQVVATLNDLTRERRC
jgi:hypothetical protein